MDKYAYLPPLIIPWEFILFFILSALCFILAFLLIRNNKRKSSLFEYVAFFGVLTFLMSLVSLIFSVGLTFFAFYMPVIFNSGWIAPLAGVTGICLFWLRRRRRDLYAALEIGGAVATIIVCAINSYGSSAQRGAALLTATYFLVRGLDNAVEGKLLLSMKNFKDLIDLNLSHGTVRRQRHTKVMLCIALLFVSLAIILPKPDSNISPPYMADKNGARLPVSPIKCGYMFVVCDKQAWQARDQLLKGTPQDRAAADLFAKKLWYKQQAIREKNRRKFLHNIRISFF